MVHLPGKLMQVANSLSRLCTTQGEEITGSRNFYFIKAAFPCLAYSPGRFMSSTRMPLRTAWNTREYDDTAASGESRRIFDVI